MTHHAGHSTGDTTVLNTLIGTLLDSVEGYRMSAEAIDRPELAAKFNARAAEREAAVRDLQGAVRAAGGEPEDDATVLGGIHRAFVGLKDAVTGRDTQAIVNEVERGEDYLKAKFETALQSDNLDPACRAAVTAAWGSVKAGHDEMSALKHAMSGAD